MCKYSNEMQNLSYCSVDTDTNTQIDFPNFIIR